jgi:transcriptional regulator with XRE-family HTH domain
METQSRFQQWRTEKGFTLEDVADLTGSCVSMISRLERGQRQPSAESKVKIARGLGVRVREIFPPVTE